MKLLDNIQDKTHRLLTQPMEELTRAQRSVRYMLDLGKYCARELRVDRAGEMAAALTYHTLFSLLPTIVLMLVVMKMFVGEVQREDLKQNAVDFALQWIQPDEGDKAKLPEDWQGPLPPGEYSPADGDAQSEFENARLALTQNIQDLIAKLEDISFGSIGIVGVILFLFAATKLLSTIEHSFNRIYDAPYGRPLYVRLPLYYTAITFAPLLVLAGQYAQTLIIGWIEQAATVTGQSVGWLGELTALLTPFATTWLVLLLLYRFLPNTKVSSKASAIGSFVAAVGWIALIEVFKIYVRGLGTSKLYGALALLPLFLLWLYFTWLIVLFGVEVTYTIQSMKGRRFKSLRNMEDRDILFDPRWMIPLVAMIGRSFQKGEPIRMNELQTASGLPNRAIANIIDMLTQAKIIHHVEHGEPGVPAYTLARPPESIGIDELLDLSEKAAMRERNRATLTGTSVVAQLHTAQMREAQGQSLADVIG